MRVVHTTPAVGALLLVTLTACGTDSEPTAERPSSSAATSVASAPGTSGATPTTSPSAPAGGQPSAITVSPEVSEIAQESAEDLIDEQMDVLASPGGSGPDPDVVAGAAAEALSNRAAEYADNGWEVRGEPKVTAIEVYEHGDGRMVIGACIDDSAVEVVDSEGTVISDGSGKAPSLNIYTLEERNRTWVVVGHTFPDDPTC